MSRPKSHPEQQPSSHWPAVVIGGAIVAAGVLGACNEHVFKFVPDVCHTDLIVEKPIDVSKPADILIVVDNSGSMCEEQANLVANFFDPDCPITDLNNVPAQYKNPSPEQAQQLASQCGFIQLLAAYDNDFRVGVITTDVSGCDNDFNQAGFANQLCSFLDNNDDWGRRPQRGCLQAPPGAPKKVIDRADQDIADRFRATLDNIRVFGSGLERGLDAVEVFLSPESTRAAGCEGDREAFLRDDAKLVVIFLTDEEDCSHADGANGFDDNGADSVEDCAAQPAVPDASRCYSGTPNSQFDKLAPVSRYVDFLNGLKGPERQTDVSVAVIAGALKNDNGGAVAGDCIVQNGQPSGQCTPSFGNSNNTAPGSVCGEADPPCCVADSGTRYFQLAGALGQGRSLTDSICFESFRNTMIAIADFVGRTDFVNLPEAPASPDAVIVRILRKGATEAEVLKPLPADADCATESGYQLINGTRVQFCGDAVPQPGDEIDVHAAANRGGADGGCAL